jgi:hypothetical protein
MKLKNNKLFDVEDSYVGVMDEYKIVFNKV